MKRHRCPRPLLLLGAGALLAALLGLCGGTRLIPPWQAAALLLGGDRADPLYRILVYVRLPRVLGALLAGGCLAAAGTVLQTVLRNPLAGPSVMGINSGAGLSLLLAAALFPARPLLLPLAAFVGSLLAALLVLGVSVGAGVSRLSLVLTGFAVNSLCGAGMNAVLILRPDAYTGAGSFLVGGLSGVTLQSLRLPGLLGFFSLTMALLCRRGMLILSMGRDTALSLGLRVGRWRILCMGVAAVLAGAAVSFAGLLGFVGLVAPHAVRLLLGNDERLLLPASALAGGMFVALCDFLSRVLFAPYELPVGILMSAVGAPFFLFLLLRRGRRADD